MPKPKKKPHEKEDLQRARNGLTVLGCDELFILRMRDGERVYCLTEKTAYLIQRLLLAHDRKIAKINRLRKKL